MYLFYYVLFYNFILCNGFFRNMNCKIIQSSIVGFLPELKLHHVVVIQPSSMKKDVYAIDFSPIQYSLPTTLIKLLFAFDVPGETRVRFIKNGALFDENNFIDIWYKTNPTDSLESQQLTDTVVHSIHDKDIKKILYEVKKWNTNMNLYTHNCQHFSEFVKNKMLTQRR